MSKNVKLTFKRAFIWGIGVFFILFFFRLLYGYIEKSTNHAVGINGDFFSSIENLRKNYASEKYAAADIKISANESTPPNFSANQKYEKTASIKSKSSKFEEDKAQTERVTKDFKAVVQYEKNEGKKGNREIHLLIGVNPILFDSFYIEIQKIGTLNATEITKIDKTNEYRQLNAKKVSFEKTLASLNELKSRGGAISDYVALHDKILDIENQMQGLGVELGNFDSENEFCSIRFSLYEGASEKKISLFYRVKVALEWTVKYYAVMVFGLLCLSGFVFILLLIITKFNLLKSIIDKSEG
jgi:Domain of unknown function (DUF4349)